MKDNNVVAFYCNNCHETVLNCEHNFEQLHEKGLCAKCLKKQNKTKDKWQKLKKFIKTYQEDVVWKNKHVAEFQEDLLDKMQKLEGEDEI